MLMRPDMPALMLLVQTLPVGFAHNPSLSQEAPDIRPESNRDSNSSNQRQAAATGDSA
jgi:hypothetical protein